MHTNVLKIIPNREFLLSGLTNTCFNPIYNIMDQKIKSFQCINTFIDARPFEWPTPQTRHWCALFWSCQRVSPLIRNLSKCYDCRKRVEAPTLWKHPDTQSRRAQKNDSDALWCQITGIMSYTITPQHLLVSSLKSLSLNPRWLRGHSIEGSPCCLWPRAGSAKWYAFKSPSFFVTL
jgi:hypothetical protein